MALLNRSAIILTPKQPYIDWTKSVFKESDLAFDPSEDDALPIFLGPEADYVEEITAFVEKHFNFFFEHWLEGWCTDKSLWPKRRTRRMFHKWFDVRVHSWVEDVVAAPYELG
jgi:hypothetical protein